MVHWKVYLPRRLSSLRCCGSWTCWSTPLCYVQGEAIRTEEDLRELTMDELKELGFKLGSRKRVLKWSGSK